MRLTTTNLLTALVLALSGCGGSSSNSPGDTDGEANLPNGSPAPVVSNFDDGTADGWMVSNSDNALISTDGSCGLVQVDPESGFLCANATEEGGTSYFIAPEKFNGDLNVYSRLKFSIAANGGNYYDTGFGFDGDIVISNGVSKATYTFAENQRPTGAWTFYDIKLNDTENWFVDNGSVLATVFQSTTELRVRAEYGEGPDNAALDDVSLE